MLEFDDIQHILLTRTPALTGRYEFLSFRSGSAARAWLNEILKTVQSAADVLDSLDEDKRWVTVAFTWNGLKALGVDEASLATFPDEFKQGMAARAEILGDVGANHPDHWIGGLASRLSPDGAKGLDPLSREVVALVLQGNRLDQIPSILARSHPSGWSPGQVQSACASIRRSPLLAALQP